SERSPVSAATPLTWNDRVRVSGLYCREIILCTTALTASINTMPPLSSRGDPGNPLIVYLLSACVPVTSRFNHLDISRDSETALPLTANLCGQPERRQFFLPRRSAWA